MPSYTHDQIREAYGELDKKSRRTQDNQHLLHKPLIDAWNEKSSWRNSSDECPLPKFRLDKTDPTILMSAYLSTGLSNPRIIPNEKEIIRGSFRTSIDDRTTISPSPLLLNVRFDFNKFITTSTNSNDQMSLLEDIQNNISTKKQSETSFDLCDIKHAESKAPIANIESMDLDLDEETTVSYQTAKESGIDTDFHSTFSTKNNETISTDLLNTITSPENSSYYDAFTSPIDHLIIKDEEDDYRQMTDDIDEDFENLYQRYLTNFNEYQTTTQDMSEFEHKLTPISEESLTLFERGNENKANKINDINPFHLILTVQRQSNHIGHYGFELEQTIDKQIKISSIIDSTYCPNLTIGDEIVCINNNSTLKTLKEYHLLFHSLWHNQCEYVQITVNKVINIPSK
jgi:hypothetical protein